MKVLGIDFESTGLDTSTDRITEVGAVLFDCSQGWAPIAEVSTLVYESDYPPLSDEVVDVTGITDSLLKEQGRPLGEALGQLSVLVEMADYFMAHNRDYDKSLLFAEIERANVGGVAPIAPMLTLPWLCTVEDMEHASKIKCRKLAHMALDYGITVNPDDLHRAVGDVRLMGAMVHASGFSLEKMIALSKTPWVYVQAHIPAPWEDGEKGKTAAQARGFRWQNYYKNGPTFKKAWVKRIKKDRVEDEQRALDPYRVELIHEEDLK